MRILGHECTTVDIEPDEPFALDCACGSTFASSTSIGDCVDQFSAHVVGHIALSALDRAVGPIPIDPPGRRTRDGG